MRVLDVLQAAEAVKGIAPVAKYIVCKRLEDAQAFAKQQGYPVVLKAVSAKIIHKTEAGAVRIVYSAEDLEREFGALRKLATIILAQEFVKGTEFILGLKKDKTFGHVVVAGIGGIYVEVYKDVTFRVCPITPSDAEQMLNDLKGAAVFTARGKNLNRKSLVDALVKLSKLPATKKTISELDINPFILNEKQGKIVDARIILE